MKVYLAGPITGASWDEATEWRAEAKKRLNVHGIEGLSPLRAKKYLEGSDKIRAAYEEFPLSSQKGLTTRDRFDCTRADLIIVNVLGTTKVSIGTVMEIAWADLYRIPVILVMEDGNVHDHPMIRETCGFVVTSIIDAVEVAISILHE